MFRLLKPVPGIEIEPSIPEGLALRVNWMGPSRIDLVNDLRPRSVMLTPAMVLSKLKAERSVMCSFDEKQLVYLIEDKVPPGTPRGVVGEHQCLNSFLTLWCQSSLCHLMFPPFSSMSFTGGDCRFTTGVVIEVLRSWIVVQFILKHWNDFVLQ